MSHLIVSTSNSTSSTNPTNSFQANSSDSIDPVNSANLANSPNSTNSHTADRQPSFQKTRTLKLLPNALPDLFAQVSATGQLTQADRYGLLAVLLEQKIEPDQYRVIDRIFYGLRRGWIELVDEFQGDRE